MADSPQGVDMPIVKMPDGTQVRFPDDMPREQIRGMIASKFPDAVPQEQAQPEQRSPEYDSALSELSALSGDKGFEHAGTMNEADKIEALKNPSGLSDATESVVRSGLPFGDEIAGAMGTLPRAIVDAVKGQGFDIGRSYDRSVARERELQRRAEERSPVASTVGSVAGGAMLANALAPISATQNLAQGAGLGKTALTSAVDSGVLGTLYGAGDGESAKERAQNALTGGGIGAAVGFSTPLVMAGASKLARRAISPFTSSPERQAAVDYLTEQGIPLTAGQKTGSQALRYSESEIGGAKAAQIIEDQGRAFTDAAMRKAGGSGLADEESLRALQSRLSKGFESVSNRNQLQADGDFLADIVGTLREYNQVLPSEQKQIFGNVVKDIGERIKAGSGTMSGKDYQSIRSRLTKRAYNSAGSDNELSAAYRGIRDALDNAMERSVSGMDKGVWKELRRQYGNSKVLMKAAKGAGEEAALGVISPARLRMAAASGNGDAYVLGNSDFSKLAKAGQAVMTPLPNSGTAGRLRAQNLGAVVPMIIGSGTGAAYGAKENGVPGALTGAVLGAMAPRAVGRIMMSGPAQSYLSNQIASGSMTPVTAGALNRLTTGGMLPELLEYSQDRLKQLRSSSH
ncbi:hypothetical protein ACLBWS_05705 [Brucellaceae bacterium D45D]